MPEQRGSERLMTRQDAAMTLWLIRRVALRGRGTAPLAALLALGTAIIVFLGLASASAIHTVERQQQRQTAMTIRTDPAQSSGAADDLRIVDPRITNARRWAGHAIRREFYASDVTTTLVPPGLTRTPAPGEYFASPDLVRLIRSDAAVASLFGSQHRAGVIGRSGLVQPHQLRAVVGVDSSAPLLTKVVGFGGHAAANVAEGDDNTVLDISVAGYVLALTWLPAAFFILIIANLAAARRRRRADALHLIGCSRRRIQLLHFAEALIISLPAALVAGIAFWALTRTLTNVPGTSFGFYPSDARIGPLAGVGIATLLLVAICTAVSLDSEALRIRRRGSRRSAFVRRATRPATGLLVIGFLLLGLPTVAPLGGPLAPLALWSGTVLSAFGLAVAGPTLVSRILTWHVDRAPAPALAGRRMAAYRVTTALRLASVMSVIIVLLLASRTFAAVLSGGSAEDWHERLDQHPSVPVTATDLSGTLSLSTVQRAAGVTAIAELRSLRGGRTSVNTVTATCAGLLGLTGAKDRGQCRGAAEPMWLSHPPGPGARDSLGTIVTAGRQVDLSRITDVLQLRGLPDAFAGALLVAPESTPQSPYDGGGTYFFVARSTALQRTLASVASLDPTIQLDLGVLDRHNPDTQAYPSQVDWLGIGACISLVLAFLSLLVVSLGEAEERSPRMRALRVIGASRRDLLASHVWCVGSPLLLIGAAAVAVGWLAGRAMRNIDERAYLDPSLYLTVLLAVPAAAVVVCCTTWPAVTRPAEQAGSVST